MKSPDQNRELFCESLGACSELVDESLRGLVRRILRPDTPGAVTKGALKFELQHLTRKRVKVSACIPNSVS